MKKIKLTFNIAENVAEMLETRVPKRKRNAFIEEAIRLRFGFDEEERFLREVVATNIIQNDQLDKIEATLDPDDADLQSDEMIDEDEILELDDFI
jgi:hypothetical protein